MLQYRVLGPLAVDRDGERLDLGHPKQRAVLAVLVQEAGAVVSTDRLLADVWGTDHSPRAVASLQANVSRLRKLLRPDPTTPAPLLHRAGGYLLDIDPAAVDVARFTADARAARRAVEQRDWVAAATAGERALAWWRGLYLEDFRDEEWVRTATASISERRAGAAQDLVVGLLGTGDVTAALARSHTVLAEQPLVERAAWLHAVALYRAGRPGEALAAARHYATTLREELGLDPGPALRDLEAAVARGDAATARWPGPPATTPTDRAAPGSGPARAPADEPAPEPRSAAGADPGEPADLVGRTPEVAAVDAVLAHARAHDAGWVVLTGGAGIGKSRLAREAARRWARAGGRVVTGHCPDDPAVPAWWPIKQVLRELGADAEAVVREPAHVDADAGRFAVLERLRDTVLAHLAEAPLLVVVEDVHWADRASLRFLAFLAHVTSLATATSLAAIGGSAPQRGLAVVLTARTGTVSSELDQVLTAVARRVGSRQVPVPPLAEADVARLVARISGAAPGPRAVGELTRRTGGNPLFVAEYARLDPGRGHAVPDAVRSVLRRRLAELPDDLLAVLRTAAVLGDPLDVGVLARVLDRDATAVEDLLDQAAEREVLVPSAGSYAFAHVLLQEEAAAGLPGLRRQRLHLRAAASIRPSAVGDAVARRAAHLDAAGPLADPAEVVAAARAAALAAEADVDTDTAARWWGVAAAAHTRVPAADSGRHDTEHDDLVRARVAALTHAGRGQDVLDVLDTALLAALRAGRTSSVGRLAANLLRVSGSWPWPAYGKDATPLLATLRGLDAVLGDDAAARARVLAVTAIGHCYDPDPAVPDGLSARAVALAESTGDPEVLADALLGRAMTFSGVAQRSLESLDLLDRLSAVPHATAATDAVLAHGLATMACMNLGRVEDGAAHVEAGTLGSDLRRLPVDRVQLRWALGCLAQWHGDLDRAQRLYAEAETAHRRTELQQSGTFELAEIVLAWERGRLHELDGTVPTNPFVAVWTTVVAAAAAGLPGADAALAAEVHRPEPVAWTSHGRLALLAHAVADRGLVELVDPLERHLRPLDGLLATLGQIGTIGPVSLALARLRRLARDHDAARGHLADALAQGRATGGIPTQLRGRLLDVEWAILDRGTSPTDAERAELTTIEAAARDRGMLGVADAAGDLAADPPRARQQA